MKRVLLAMCAGTLFGWAVGAAGCDDGSYNPGAESGGSKEPELELAASTGRPASGSASAMAQSTPPAMTVFPAVPCGEGRACAGAIGCASACDPATAVVTSCTRCDDGAFAGCSERACPP
jgi:hypothetical protein